MNCSLKFGVQFSIEPEQKCDCLYLCARETSSESCANMNDVHAWMWNRQLFKPLAIPDTNTRSHGQTNTKTRPHTHTHTTTKMTSHAHAHTHTHTHTHTNTHTHRYVYEYTRTQAYVYVCAHVPCTDAYMCCEQMRVCVYVCVYVFVEDLLHS